jgi:hypothetical protein
MKKIRILATFVLAVALLGCGKHQPRHIIILPDVSGSIDRQSLEQAFKAIEELASHLRRGDELTIIPIRGDAEAEAPGAIMRFRVPPNRGAYDADLRKFATQLNKSLEQLAFSAIKHPGTRTDILGSIAVASHEIGPNMTAVPTLIILSDFIQDDGESDFLSDSRLKDSIALDMFARKMAEKQPLNLSGRLVYFSKVGSTQTALEAAEQQFGNSGSDISNISTAHPTFQMMDSGC